MTLNSGFGTGKMGLDAFGQTNFARKILLENLPGMYLEEDINQGFIFTKFIESLYPHTNEFRNYLDKFPLIRSPEDIPTDNINFFVFASTLAVSPPKPNPEIQVVTTELPFLVPGNILRVRGDSDDPFRIFNIAVIEVQNDFSRVRVGSPWPFSTKIRNVEFNDVEYSFLMENNSDFLYAVPEVFPDVKVGDFVQVGDNRVAVTNINTDMFRITLTPIPPLARLTVVQGRDLLDGETFTINDGIHAPTTFEFDRNNLVVAGDVKVRTDNLMLVQDVRDLLITTINGVGSTLSVKAFPLGSADISIVADIFGTVTITDTVGNPNFSVFDYSRLELTRLSRLPLLTFLAHDIGWDDDATKLEIIRRGIVLHAVQLYRLIGAVKGYKARGGIEGLLVDVYNWNRVPCQSCNFKIRAAGSIQCPTGDVIPDGYTITLDDATNPPTVFEFNKTGGTTGTIVEITDLMSAAEVADAFAAAIRNVGSSLLIEVALVDDDIIQIRNTQAAVQGIVSQSGSLFPLTPFPPVPPFPPFYGPSTLEYKVVVLCDPTTVTRDPLLYVSTMDDVPADLVFADDPTTEKYFDLGIPTGHITTISGDKILDGATFTLDDGINTATVFEFDKDGSVLFGHIPVAILDTDSALVVRNKIVTAVNGVGAALAIAASNFDSLIGTITYPLPSDTKLVLKNEDPNPVGIIDISETITDTGFVLDGMSSEVDEDLFPVVYPDFRSTFKVVGVNFNFEATAINKIKVFTLQADVIVGDIIDFGDQQRTVTAVTAAPLQDPGEEITLDAVHGITLGDTGSVSRVSRLPDLTNTGDFLTVAGFDYKIVYYDPSTATGRTDFSLRDTTLINKTVAATRTRKRSITRDVFDDYSRTAFLKLHLTPIDNSLFFTGFESVTKYIAAMAEVTPIHVEIIDTQFEASGIITVPIPRVYIEPTEVGSMVVSIGNNFDTIAAEDAVLDSTLQVIVET
jgi:hypothetical protein